MSNGFLDKYLTLAKTEDVFFTVNGKVIAKLTRPNTDVMAERVEMAKSIVGIIPADITADEALGERVSKI